MLTAQEIITEIAAGGITVQPPTDPSKPSKIVGTSYQLSASRVIHISPFSPEDGVRMSSQEHNFELTDQHSYVLRPGVFVQLEVAESFKLGPRLFGSFGIVSSVANAHGLIVQCGQLSPNYTGALRFGVFNAGTESYVLRKGESLVRLYFHRLLDDFKIEKVEAKRLDDLTKNREMRAELLKERAELELARKSNEARLAILEIRLKELRTDEPR